MRRFAAPTIIRRCLAPLMVLFCALIAAPACAKSLPESGGYIHRTGSPRVVVFIHGLYSSPEAWRCDEKTYWPEMIASDPDPAFRNTDIYVASYPSPKSHNHMAVSDIVTLISNRLTSDKVFSTHKQIIFIAHSLGGILVQQLLLTYRDEDTLSKVQFIYLYGTPLEGSTLASWFKHFSRDPLLKELASGEGNFILKSMDEQWLHARLKIPRYCAYETQPEHGFKVVNYNSATRGCNDNVAIPANHSTIVKPCTRQSDSYIALKNKLADLPFNHISAEISVETERVARFGGGVSAAVYRY